AARAGQRRGGPGRESGRWEFRGFRCPHRIAGGGARLGGARRRDRRRGRADHPQRERGVGDGGRRRRSGWGDGGGRIRGPGRSEPRRRRAVELSVHMGEPDAPAAARRWRPGRAVDVVRVLAPHQRGPYDPTHQVDSDAVVWRTARPAGEAATVRIAADSRAGEVDIRAWGPGAAAAVELAPGWLGAHDDDTGFRPAHSVLARAVHELPGLRIGRTGLVLEALVPAVLEQKVTGIEAHRGWRAIVRRHGEPAPGPRPGLWVVPAARAWSAIPSWEWHRGGVGPQ